MWTAPQNTHQVSHRSWENLESHETENPIPLGLKSQAILVSCSVVVIQNL